MEFISKVNPFKKIANNLSGRKHQKEKSAHHSNGVSYHDSKPWFPSNNHPTTFTECTSSVVFNKELVWNENKLYRSSESQRSHDNNVSSVSNKTKGYDKDYDNTRTSVAHSNKPKKPTKYVQYDNGGFQVNNTSTSTTDHHGNKNHWYVGSTQTDTSFDEDSFAMRYYRNSLLLGTSAYQDNYMGAMQYYGNRHQPTNVADSNGVVMRSHGNKQSSFNKEKRRSFVSKSSKNLGRYLELGLPFLYKNASENHLVHWSSIRICDGITISNRRFLGDTYL